MKKSYKCSNLDIIIEIYSFISYFIMMKTKRIINTLLFVLGIFFLSGTNVMASEQIVNGSFENYEILKDNGSWKIAYLEGWNSIEVPKLDKAKFVNFDLYEITGTEVWKNKGKHTRYGVNQIELDSYGARPGDTHIDAIYQKFSISEPKTLIFNMYARKVGSSDVEIFIDGMYKETITPTKKYLTYMYELQAGEHSIMFKEVDSQDDGAGAIIDGVVVLGLSEMRSVLPYENGISKKAVQVIINDEGLKNNTTYDDIYDGAYFANEMGNLIYTEISNLGYMSDAKFTADEMKSFNTHMFQKYNQKMIELHGDDEKGEETGFHLVQNDGATTKLTIPGINKELNAVNTVGDGIFHFGLYDTVNEKKILNEDGNNNQTWVNLAKYMNFCLNEELAEIKEELIRKLNMEVGSGEWLGDATNTIGSSKNNTGVAIFNDLYISNSSIINFTLNGYNDGKYQNGFLVFDYISPNEFKYIGARIGADQWVVGQYKDGKYKNKKSLKEQIDTNIDYSIDVQINGGEILMKVNGIEKVKYNFGTEFNSKVGYALEKANTNFKDIEIYDIAN